MKKEKVFIEGYEVGFLSGTDGTREKKIQVASGEIVSIDEHFIYKSIEPEKVTIPKFVADYIEFQKKYNFHVYGAMRVIEDHYDKRVPEWFYEKNIELFARAWLDGYEVEKEPKYTVKFKATNQYLCDDDDIGLHISPSFRSNFRKSDLEKLSLTEVFDSPLFEVEEV